MKYCAFVLLAGLVACTQANLWDDVKGTAADAGNFFKNKFTDFKDLFANDYDSLKKNVGNTEGLLTTLDAKKAELMTNADSTQKAALNQVSGWKNEVTAFKTKVETEGASKFSSLKTEWQTLVTKMFDSGKLAGLVKLANGGTTVAVSVMALLTALAAHALFGFRY